MNGTDDLVRTALRETAAEISPRQVPPLRLPAEEGTAGRRHGARWPQAMAAAAAVLAIGIAAMTLAGAHRSAAPADSLAQLPPYYVALEQRCPCHPPQPGRAWQSDPDLAVVRTTAGRVLATVRVPAPYATFTLVRAARDDRTFVLAAQRLSLVNSAIPATRFYLLRIRPFGTTGRATLTPLPVPQIHAGSELADMALSPDGSRLAVLVSHLEAPTGVALTVYDLGTGSQRSWTVSQAGPELKWGPDNRTLAVPLAGQNRAIGLVDTAATGSGFRSAERVIQLGRAVPGRGPVPPGYFVVNGELTPDGRHILLTEESPVLAPSSAHVQGDSALWSRSLRTGTVTKILTGVPPFTVGWSSPSGSEVLIFWEPSGTASGLRIQHATLFYRGGRRAVTLSPGLLGAAW